MEMMMTKIGYTRVSTTDQTTDRQELGDIRIFEDKASGKNTDRPALKEMLAYVREGDEIVVFSIDRLARNLRDLEDIITEVNSKGASVTFLTERLTFSGSDDAMSTLMLQMMGSFAQFERSMIRKRQAEGIALAKAKGENSPYKGRKASIDRSVITDMINAGSSVTAIARALNISRQSVYRIKTEVA
jgi:DNA invertase Pin-like site-specific DNA recombinase